jgi:hypothetical protein
MTHFAWVSFLTSILTLSTHLLIALVTLDGQCRVLCDLNTHTDWPKQAATHLECQQDRINPHSKPYVGAVESDAVIETVAVGASARLHARLVLIAAHYIQKEYLVQRALNFASRSSLENTPKKSHQISVTFTSISPLPKHYPSSPKPLHLHPPRFLLRACCKIHPSIIAVCALAAYRS